MVEEETKMGCPLFTVEEVLKNRWKGEDGKIIVIALNYLGVGV